MQLSSILKADAVKSIASCTSKKRLFHDLGEVAESCYGLNASDVVEALIDREGLGPTGVGQGIALPHARLEDAKSVFGLFLRLEKPLDFDAVDRQPVDLVFALIAPKDAGVDHLKALALVSRTLRDKAVCTKLRSNSDANTLHTILTEVEASQAA
ncbi:phosphotransferase IIA-like nitrogen-regulatory protein PtsN [Yoonia maricola]|uniref:Phosphotransferase IIA-like nitrogen-regulatory protein PtsN n=1 Tax=Yoonia maricola TaxID=420999 RepID=A0A2M8W4F6_9RHOB|nr:PTS sugar transporter subunit IIA [Yoonia maricola]PJI85798.1 phosphotransferase IIA-like nitrogen-regulatory protein PtsN [Yoonia maricola]